MYRILIVEDDPVIAESMATALSGWGYETGRVTDFEHVMRQFAEFSPQMVLLDLSLPFRSGFYWCSEIRKISRVPVIFVSSAADDMNLLTALHQGADDFIVKPFDLQVLVAKMQALLRRTYDFSAPAELLSHRGAVLNLNDATLHCGEKKQELTRNEYRILELLLQNKGHILSREAIMRRLWDDESFIDDNTLTVNMTRLRKKLEELDLYDFIVTKKGQGYLVEE